MSDQDRKQALTMAFRVIVDQSTSMNLRAERRESRMEGVAEGAMMLHLFALEAGLDHAIVVTPICPHALTNRPLVIVDRAAIEVRLRTADIEVHATLDGQEAFPLRPDDRVRVTRSPRAVRLVRAPGRGYFEVLRAKLKWGESNARSRGR